MPEISQYKRPHQLAHQIDWSPVYFEGSNNWKLSWDGLIGHLYMAVDERKVDRKWEAFVVMFDGGDVCGDCRGRI